MNDLKEQIESNIKNIEKMETFVALSLRRENITENIQPLVANVDNVHKLMLLSYKTLNNELQELETEYDELMRRMRQQQSILMEHLLNRRRKEMQQKMDEAQQSETVLASSKKSNIPGLPESFLEMNINNRNITPKCTIDDYKQSPFVHRKRLQPIPFAFLEFDIQLTSQLFATIPKYMRGRETFEELNDFLQSTIIACFNDKYKLLHRKRSSVRHGNELELWKLYNEQTSYLPGKYFITPGDIARKIAKMMDKKLLNRITMLRHIGYLQEQRVSQVVCYIWTANAK